MLDWRVLILVSLCVSAYGQNCQDANCMTCSDPAVCDVCNYEHYMKNNVCTLCSFSGCMRCNETICLECHSGFFWNSSSHLCENCWEKMKCLSCVQNGSCSNCNYRYYLNGDKCVPCGASCYDCDITGCSRCQQSYFVQNGKCAECDPSCYNCVSLTNCSSCQSGYFHQINTCLPCSDVRCSYCTDNITCLSCKSGYYVQNKTCLSCLQFNCLQCSSPDYCQVCLPGFRRYTNGTCEKCNVSQCSSCLRGFCSECFSGYYLDLSVAPSCRLCSQLNCSVCYSNATCNQCMTGFMLTNNGLCISCNTTNCDTCPQQVCTHCKSTFYLDSVFMCQPCPISNCDQCGISSCISCLSGHFLIDGECVGCPFSNCKICDKTMGFCLVCDDNYFYDQLGCKSCLQINCSKCDANGHCTACLTNTILVGSVCTPCPLPNCFTCASSTVCLNCVQGYHWNNANSVCEELANETPWWFWTVIGVAGVVIVLGTALFILRWWNNRKLEQFSKRVEYEEVRGAVSGQNYVELKSKK